jgi:hypothetical protein
VTLTVSASDPDAAASDSPHVPFDYQVKWFMNGYGWKTDPTYVTDDTTSSWNQVTHVYNSAGTYTVRAEVMDEWRALAWKEITLNVNTPPVAGNDAAQVEANHAVTIDVLANDYDPDGHAISISSVTAPAQGTAEKAGGAVLYTSTNTWTGSDTFTYTIQDTMGGTDSATVTVTVVEDVSPPTLLAAQSAGDSNSVTVFFDEPVEPGSGPHGAENTANYHISYGVTVTNAVIQPGGDTVKLGTTTLLEGIDYVLTVNNVRDVSPAANTIRPDSQVAFQHLDAYPGMYYEYYEGSWNALPGFDALTPKKTGAIDNFDISVADRSDNFAFRFTGGIQIQTGGDYTFYTASDDGSKLAVNGTTVVNNDGLHGTTEKSGVIHLNPGLHDIVVTHFEKTGGQALAVRWQGPGIAKQTVPDDVLYRYGGQAPLDGDGDGISDNWEILHFGGTNVVDGSLSCDSDGDGLCDLHEFKAGTCPTNPASVLEVNLVEMMPADAGVVLEWPSVVDKAYAIDGATNLPLGFDIPVAVNLPATPPINTYTDIVERIGPAFYRIRLEE